jgi:hypothetical protein
VVFDTNATDLDPSPLFGRYAFEFMEVFTDHGLIFRSGPPDSGTGAGLTIDRQIQRFQVRGFPPSSQSEHVVTVFFPAGTFADDRPPTSLPFATATEAHYGFHVLIGALASRAVLTEYSASVVPEPGNLVVAGALFSLIGVGRRHRVSSRSRPSPGSSRSEARCLRPGSRGGRRS